MADVYTRRSSKISLGRVPWGVMSLSIKPLKGPIIASVIIGLTLLWVASFSVCPRPALAQSPVRLVINGVGVKTDVSPRIVNGRTLVPLRVISENLGLSVAWEPRDYSVSVSGFGRSVLVRVGDTRAVVDGKELALDVPPVIVSGRTLVPIRFVASAFGSVVDWDPGSRTVTVQLSRVTHISWARMPEGCALVVRTTAPVSYSLNEVSGGGDGRPSLALDVSPAILDFPADPIVVDEAGVSRIVPVNTGAQPSSVRVKLELEERVRYRLMASPDRREIRLHVSYQLANVAYRKGTEGDQLVIEANGPFAHEVSRLSDPDRIVIDLKGLVMAESVPAEIELGGPAQRARIAQFSVDPDVVRVVIDMKERAGYKIDFRGDQIIVTFSCEIRGVNWKKMPGRVRISVNAERPLAFNVFDLKEPTRLVIDIPDAFYPEGRSEYEVDGQDSPLCRIVVAQNSVDPDIVRIVLHLRYYAGYHVVKPDEEGTGLVLDVLTSSLNGKRLVIDPGHGGSDPGAIGVSGAFEKDLNLQIGKAVERKLLKSGAEVVMTRYDDRDVGLVERPGLANRLGADAFISIHCNSFTDSSKRGTETFYYSNHPESAYLAQLLYESLVSIGLYGRGVRSERFVVLREAAVPAALIEVAFVSNPDEERLLKDPVFQEKVAQAVVQGISKFFESRSLNLGSVAE